MKLSERLQFSPRNQISTDFGAGDRSREMLRRVARGGVTAFFAYGVGIALTYGAQLVIARTVGAETYGVYAYAFAWVVILSYVTASGFDVALLRFIPTYQSRDQADLLKGVVRAAQVLALGIGSLVILAGSFVVLASSMSEALRNSFLIGFVIVPIMALVRIRCAIVRALGAVVSALAPDRVVRDGLLIAILLISAFVSWGRLDAPFVMAATLAGAVVSLAVTVPTVGRRLSSLVDGVAPKYEISVWARSALPLVLIGGAEALMNRTGILALGWFGETRAAGIYGLAFNISLVVTLPRIALNTLFAPEISSLYARNEKESLQLLISRSTSWTLASSIAVAIVLYVFARPLFSWFGPGYEDGVSALRVLLIGQVIAASAGSQLYVMTMTGHEWSAARLLIACALVNGIVSIALVAPFNLVGVAASSAVFLVVWNIAMALFLWRRLNIAPGILSRWRAGHAVTTAGKTD